MRPILFLLVFLMPFSYGLNAQNSAKTTKVYKVWVTKMDGSKTKGVLYSADEQSIKIAKNKSFSSSDLIVIDGEKIDLIKIRRRGKIGRSTWIGAASGVGFGVLFGLAVDEGDGYGGLVTSATGLFFGIVGTGVGAGVGTIKKRIRISGNSEIFSSNLAYLQSISLLR
jgi:small nuclear ribonucleoprotein (snRNP)-like protein